MKRVYVPVGTDEVLALVIRDILLRGHLCQPLTVFLGEASKSTVSSVLHVDAQMKYTARTIFIGDCSIILSFSSPNGTLRKCPFSLTPYNTKATMRKTQTPVACEMAPMTKGPTALA